MTDLRTRLIAPCAEQIFGTRRVIVDLGALVERLLLFDTYILDSVRLRELPHLVRAFGYDAVCELFASGAVQIRCDPTAIACGEEPVWSRSLRNHALQAIGPFGFGLLRIVGHQQFVQGALAAIQPISDLTHDQTTRLETVVAAGVLPPLPSVGDPALRQLRADIAASAPHIKQATAMQLCHVLGGVAVADLPGFQLAFEPIEGTAFQAHTDIAAVFRLPVEQVHQVINSGILAVSALSQNFEDMETYKALVGLRVEDYPIFEAKLGFLARQLDPHADHASFFRVLEASGFPDLSAAAGAGQIDLKRLLDLRQTDECKQFRHWLRSVDSLSDEDLRQAVAGVKQRLATMATGTIGKTLRWAATNGLSFVPVIGPLLGPAADLLDTFLVERFFRTTGPTVFLGRQFPTIFRSPASCQQL